MNNTYDYWVSIIALLCGGGCVAGSVAFFANASTIGPAAYVAGILILVPAVLFFLVGLLILTDDI